LFYAARDGRLEVVKYLVSLGIDYNHKDTKNFTALSYAKRYNRTDVVDFLNAIIHPKFE